MSPTIEVTYKLTTPLVFGRHNSIEADLDEELRQIIRSKVKVKNRVYFEGSGCYLPESLRDISYRCKDLSGLRKARKAILKLKETKHKNIKSCQIFVDA